MCSSMLKFGKVSFSALFEHVDDGYTKWQGLSTRYKMPLSEFKKECIVSIIRNSVMSDGFEDNVSAQNFLFVMTPFGAFHTHKTNFIPLY